MGSVSDHLVAATSASCPNLALSTPISCFHSWFLSRAAAGAVHAPLQKGPKTTGDLQVGAQLACNDA